MTPTGPGATVEQVLAAAPPVRREPGARERIRAMNVAAGRRIAVLDDDPTGSQTVHDVSVVTVFEAAEYAAGLAHVGDTCFILTNTRSLPEAAAVELTTAVANDLLTLDLGGPVEIISRSDSTLRGHVLAEIDALNTARQRVMGRPYDGILLVPAYFEAGRFTAGDIHWAKIEGRPVPAGATEFAQDATFGYRSSNLKEFIAEKSGGRIQPAQVGSISLTDIRQGGPDRVAEILDEVSGGAFVVVNATEHADLDVVVLGLLQVQQQGKAFAHRAGPTFPQVLSGLDPHPPLTAEQIWPQGRPAGHGLVVVGSHVGLTSRQVAAAQTRGHLTEIELDVSTLLDARRGPGHVRDTGRRVAAALAHGDVLLYTSRTLRAGTDAQHSLAISRTVSTAVIEVVRAALPARPAWVIAKGGITSHDVAVRGLGIRRATVLGQLLPGLVSVFLPIEAAAEAIGTPYVVFAGNVGDDNTLADVIDLFTGRR